MNKESKKIAIEIQRKDGKTFFRFKVDARITALYKSQSDEVRESTNWQGLSFYYTPRITASDAYRRMLGQYNLFDDFGNGIYEGGKLNIAFIRATQGEGEIVIGTSLPFAELSQMTRNAVLFLKEYFENYVKDCTIRGNLSIEI